jgi:hypothetical protein
MLRAHWLAPRAMRIGHRRLAVVVGTGEGASDTATVTSSGASRNTTLATRANHVMQRPKLRIIAPAG